MGKLSVWNGTAWEELQGAIPPALIDDVDTAKTEASLAVSRVFDVERFLPGAATIADAWQTAIDTANAAGGGRVVSKTPAQTLTKGLTLKDNVYLDGFGDVALTFQSGATPVDGALLRGKGTLTALPNLSTLIAQDSETITFVSSPSVIPGDVLVIHNPAAGSFSPWRDDYRNGEYVRVLSKSGNTITTTTSRYAAYPTTAKVYRMNPVRTGIAGMRVKGLAGSTLIKITHGVDLDLRDLELSGSNLANLNIDKSYKVALSNIRATDYGASVSTNYGIMIANSQHVYGDHLFLETTRHGLTFGGDSITGSVPNRDIKIRDSFVNGVSVDTTVAGFSPHGNTEMATFENVTFANGLVVSGDKLKFDNCDIYSSRSGEVMEGYELLGADIEFNNCRFIVTRNYDNFTNAAARLLWSTPPSGTLRSGGKTKFHNCTLDLGPYTRSDGVTLAGLYLYNAGGLPPDNDLDIDIEIVSTTTVTKAIEGLWIRCAAGRAFRNVHVALQGNVGVWVDSVGPKYLDFRGTTILESLAYGIQVTWPASPVYSESTIVLSDTQVIGAGQYGCSVGGRASDTTIIMDDSVMLDCATDGLGSLALRGSMYLHHAKTLIRRNAVIGDRRASPLQQRADTITDIGVLIDYDTVILGTVTPQTRSAITTSRVRTAP